MFWKGLFKRNKKKVIKSKGRNTDTNTNAIDCKIISGIFYVNKKLIAGAYYYDDEIKVLATNLGCIKLEERPKLVEDKNVNTLKIESLIFKLRNKKVEEFISLNELV